MGIVTCHVRSLFRPYVEPLQLLAFVGKTGLLILFTHLGFSSDVGLVDMVEKRIWKKEIL